MITLYIFLLSFGVVLGGWYLARTLLEQRQKEFLAGTGEILIQSPETALLSVETQENAVTEVAAGIPFQGEALTEEMMAKVLDVWERGGRAIPHEPKKGQMNMEQAIEAGKEWIAVMAEQGIIPFERVENGFDHITARLCTLEVQVDFDESLLSYWSIQFLAYDVEVRLTIHAVSGEIWIAKIQMEDPGNLAGTYRLEDLLEAVFPFTREGQEIMIALADNTVREPMPQKLVYASAKEFSLRESEREPIIQMEFWLSTG